MNRKWFLAICMVVLSSLIVDQSFGQGRGKGQRGSRQKGGMQQQGKSQRGKGNQHQKGRFGQGNSARTGQGQKGGSSGKAGNLTDMDVQNLVLMREEEKLARDVYSALYAKWGDKVFANIAGAESRHMMAVGNLLSNFGIADPIKNQTAGVFTDPKLQKLYDTLVATGTQSLQAALKVGLQIEEMDIADLKSSLESTNNRDIERVLGNLMRGSQSHLRAFASKLNAAGGSYTPQHLTQKEFDQILTSQGSRGGGFGRKAGPGNQRSTKSGSGMGSQNRGKRGQGKMGGRGGS